MLRVFIPAYNEETVITHNIRNIHTILSTHTKAFMLYLVDDGSTDPTPRIAHTIKLPHFRYLRCNGPSRRENLAQMMASYAKPADIICFMDADRSTGEEALQKALDAIQHHGYDIVIGSRYTPGARIQRKLDRLLISRFFNAFVRIYFHSRIQDHECGFKFFKGTVIKNLVAAMGINYERKMFWDSEMLIRAQRARYRILEVPVYWVEGPKSALSFRSELPMIRYILALRFRLPKM